MYKFTSIVLGIVTSLYLSSCSSDTDTSVPLDIAPSTTFVINGNINEDVNKVFLHRQIEGKLTVVDSLELENATFQFIGEIEFPELVYLSFDGKNYTGFFIENDTIQVQINNLQEKEFTVSNSITDSEYRTFKGEVKIYSDQLDTLSNMYYAAKENGTEESLALIDAQYDSLDIAKTEFIKGYVLAHPNSMATPYIVVRNLIYDLEASDIMTYLDAFGKDVRKSKHAVYLEERYNKIEKLEVGKIMENFSQMSTDSILVNLTDFEGQYVLIDFWASWCGPCRAENPNVVRAHDSYKDKGFTVLGISLDDDKAAWLKAIESDELAWTQLSDLQGWDNEISQSFGIMGIPASYLIGPNREILAKNLREEDLQEFLADLFK